MKFKANIQVEIRDKNGKIIRTIKKPCKSYVRQIVDLLRCHALSIDTSIKDIGGTVRTVTPYSGNLSCYGGAGDAGKGIVVGRGNGAVVIEDFKLGTICPEGTGLNQLNYLAVSVGAVTIIGSTAQYILARTMTNNSALDIDVKEVGIYALGRVAAISYYFMIERSLLEFTIAKGESSTITYTISVTV